MATTISIYEAIGRNLGDVLAKGAPTGATGTTMESNMLFHLYSQQLQGRDVYIYTGEGAGQTRTVATFDPANNRICIEPAWDTVPTADSRFIMFKHFITDDYEHAMNRAMGRAALMHLEDKVATIAVVATQYEYAIPSGFEWINTLRLVPSSHSDYQAVDDIQRWFEFPPRFWRIEANQGGSYVIAFDPRKIDLDDFNNQILNVHGQVKPDFDASLISDALEEFIIAEASMLMASQRISENQEWRAKFYMFRDEVKGRGTSAGLEDYIFVHGRGKRVR